MEVIIFTFVVIFLYGLHCERPFMSEKANRTVNLVLVLGGVIGVGLLTYARVV